MEPIGIKPLVPLKRRESSSSSPKLNSSSLSCSSFATLDIGAVAHPYRCALRVCADFCRMHRRRLFCFFVIFYCLFYYWFLIYGVLIFEINSLFFCRFWPIMWEVLLGFFCGINSIVWLVWWESFSQPQPLQERREQTDVSVFLFSVSHSLSSSRGEGTESSQRLPIYYFFTNLYEVRSTNAGLYTSNLMPLTSNLRGIK